MQVGIIGTGHVGQALATGLSTAGHDVLLGSRTPETTVFDGATVVTQRAAAEQGDVVVLAVPAGSVVDVAGELADALAGKPLVDATNEYPSSRSDRSLGERVADAAPAAHVVKAFNTIGANLMTDPVLDGEAATMFLAGDDDAAVETVGSVVADLGFEPVVAGDLAAAGHLENLGRLWIHLSQLHGRDIAFRFLQD
ncbi:NADPH-dependent F420 reductase [Haloarchaeobius baliensis]|uniref:NADPH-dependent F420 reductase n=1 Tax=Haloarchaeobius baliensis TaxID=1670458 RepID=UPI003F88305C